MTRMLRRGLACCTVLMIGRSATAQQADTIVGRVTSHGVPIGGATIVATRAPDRQYSQTQSDSAGRFMIVVADGSGDYLLHVSSPGMQPYRRRIHRSGRSLRIIADSVELAPITPTQLKAVNVRAERTRPQRNNGDKVEVGATEKVADAFVAGTPPETADNVNAAALSLPGVVLTDSGYSVLGLSDRQNSTTLDGMSFRGRFIPRATPLQKRVTLNTYDPARGWFSGGNTNLEIESGGPFVMRTALLTTDASNAASPVVSRRNGLAGAAVGWDVNLGGSGPLTPSERYFYSAGVEATRRVSPIASLLALGTSGLAHLGIAVDSATRLRQLLLSNNLPADAGPAQAVADRFSLIARIDRAPFDLVTYQPSKEHFSVTGFGSFNEHNSVGINPATVASRASTRRESFAGVQAGYSAFLSPFKLLTLKANGSVSQNQISPATAAPAAGLLMQSATAGEATSSLVAFGGSGAGIRRWTTPSFEAMGQFEFAPATAPRHRIKLTGDAHVEQTHRVGAPNELGTYFFKSLSDLENSRPAAFTRFIGNAEAKSSVLNAFIAAGDAWRVAPRLEIQYGLRVEQTHALSEPRFDPVISSVFGTKTNNTVRGTHVSPRLGLTWTIAGAGNNGSRVLNPLGLFHMGPTTYIRAGVGEFRNRLSGLTLLDPIASTGDVKNRAISCAGDAVPPPDWWRMQADTRSIPTDCAPSTSTAGVPDTGRSVTFLAHRFAPERVWRGNVGFATELHNVMLSAEVIGMRGFNQPRIVDLNRTYQTAFLTSDERRPVFAPKSAISPGGIIGPAASRLSPQFSGVWRLQSDLQSKGRQLVITVSPDLFSATSWWTSLAYVLTEATQQASGHDATTSDDPNLRYWMRSTRDARHAFVWQAGFSKNGVTLGAVTRVTSGFPFTPLIAGDVNGDALANDRAYIFDPFTSANAGNRSSELQALLGRLSRSVATCLRRQFNSFARPNSCESPWTTTTDAQLVIANEALQRHHVLAISIYASNVVSGIDQWLHGINGLRGWGATGTLPDPYLYYVTGFDSAQGVFRYAVNQRFGQVPVEAAIARNPARLTLEVRLSLNQSFPAQQLARYVGAGRAGRPGTKLSAEQMKAKYERSLPDPYADILQEADSLLLTPEQEAEIQAVREEYRQRLDTIWMALAKHLAGLPEQFDAARALERQEHTISLAREFSRVSVRTNLPRILSPLQLRMLPGSALELYRATEPTSGGRTIVP